MFCNPAQSPAKRVSLNLSLMYCKSRAEDINIHPRVMESGLILNSILIRIHKTRKHGRQEPADWNFTPRREFLQHLHWTGGIAWSIATWLYIKCPVPTDKNTVVQTKACAVSCLHRAKTTGQHKHTSTICEILPFV